MTEIRAAASFPPHYAESGAGSDAVRRQVIQIASGFVPHQTDVPGVPGVGLPDSGHATGCIWLALRYSGPLDARLLRR